MNRINTKIGMSMRACNLSRMMDDIIWYYEDTKRFYDWAAIRYAIRYKGASDNLWMVKRWLNDHRQEYEDAKEERYRGMEGRNMKKYSAGFVRPLFNVFEEQGAKE